ncbi:PPPDE putative peptidase domain-containing protein [Chlamydoabsidia padenii]|nr:PPPDE putative peptidase domain-containing protein [Chlamydoabsidia padenii]
MIALKTSFARSGLNSQQENHHEVFVNVYDMLQPSFLTRFGYYALGIGIYHSGVEICGKEYCFGGHEYKNVTGVFAVEPKVGPPGLLFKQSIRIGTTRLTKIEILEQIQSISKEYVGTSYHLLTRNCNHFTDDFCAQLTGKHAPSWINRAAKLGTLFPCVIPTEWIEPPEFDEIEDTPTSILSYESQGSPEDVQIINNNNKPSPPSRDTSVDLHQPEQPHHLYSLSINTTTNRLKHPRSSGDGGESIFFGRTSSPSFDAYDDQHQPVKEPYPDVIRSVTQLSITASLQGLDR